MSAMGTRVLHRFAFSLVVSRLQGVVSRARVDDGVDIIYDNDGEMDACIGEAKFMKNLILNREVYGYDDDGYGYRYGWDLPSNVIERAIVLARLRDALVDNCDQTDDCLTTKACTSAQDAGEDWWRQVTANNGEIWDLTWEASKALKQAFTTSPDVYHCVWEYVNYGVELRFRYQLDRILESMHESSWGETEWLRLRTSDKASSDTIAFSRLFKMAYYCYPEDQQSDDAPLRLFGLLKGILKYLKSEPADFKKRIKKLIGSANEALDMNVYTDGGMP